MRLLSLIPSAHPSAWRSFGTGLVRQETLLEVHRRDAAACRFCGQQGDPEPGIVYLDGDRDNATADNLATACILCAAPQNLTRRSAAMEVLPIWLPELTQRALNTLIRGLQDIRVAQGFSPCLEICPPHDTPRDRQIAGIYTALAERALDLEARSGIAHPAELASLFLRIDPRRGACPVQLLHGLRFLHRGRHFSGVRDIYPRLLEESVLAKRNAVRAA
jgi:hypothetical protein